MIKFSISGEIEREVSDGFRVTRKNVVDLLNNELGDKDYGNGVDKLFLAPMILYPGLTVTYKERRLFKSKTKTADYRLKIELEAWTKGSERERRKMLVDILLSCVEDVDRKLKGSFNGQDLARDINVLFDGT